MRITEITVSVGQTKSTGDYGNLRAEVTLTAKLDPDDDAAIVTRRLQDDAGEMVAVDIELRVHFAKVIREKAKKQSEIRHFRGVYERQCEYLLELHAAGRSDEATFVMVQDQIRAAAEALEERGVKVE
jgi:hypothetical protein